MKYLQDYVNEKQTQALDKAGAIFAFSMEQFNESKKEGVKYVNAGMGMLCPKDTIDELIADLNRIHEEGMQEDIRENGLEKIILRELNNHEAYYTRDLHDTFEAVKDYGVTMKDVAHLFNNKNYKLNK